MPIRCAVILAAGKGKRLHPLNQSRSKAMLPVVGKPMIARVMESMIANDIHQFIIVASMDDMLIQDYFSQDFQLSASVDFVFQPQPRGMADALACAASLIPGDFILSACDNLISGRDIHRMITTFQQPPQPNAVLCLMPVEPAEISRTGIVALEGPWVRQIVEKPTLENAPSNIASLPVYCFSPRILEYLEDIPISSRGEYELQYAIQKLIDLHGSVTGVQVDERLTLTTPMDLLNINCYFLMKDGVNHNPVNPGLDTVFLPPLFIEDGVTIGDSCTLGPEVYIESNCQIGERVSIQRAVILEGSSIPDHTRILNQVIG